MILIALLFDLMTIVCKEEVNTTGWRVQHFLNGDGHVIDSYRIKALDTLAKKFIISFDLERPAESPQDIFVMRDNELLNEILAIRFVENELTVQFSVNSSDTLLEFRTQLNGGWNNVKLVQKKDGNFYSFSIIVSDKVRLRTTNLDAKIHSDIDIFVPDYKKARFSGGPFLRYLNLYAKDCSIRNGDCFDVCSFEEVSETISCSCLSGDLQDDRRSCNFAEHVFFTSGRNILRINPDGEVTSFGETLTGHISCVTHAYNNRMVLFIEAVRWTGKTCVSVLWKQDLKTNITQKVSEVSYCVQRIAYHAWNDRLFFTTRSGYIGRIDGVLHSSTLSYYDVTKLKETRGLVLDECKGLLFVADLSRQAVLSISMLGRKKVIAEGLYRVTSLALNRHKFKLYWGDSYSNVIEESNYDGSCRRTIAFLNDVNIFAMTYYSGQIYWVERRTVYETILWRTDISTGISQIETADQQQIFDVQTYTEENKVSCEVTCQRTASNLIDSTITTRLNFYLYPYKLNESIHLPKGHNVSQLVLLDRNISLFGRQASKLYISPKGFISLEPVTYPITYNSLGTNLLAVYAGDTTNRFIGDVYVDITTNSSIYAPSFKESGTHFDPEHVIVVTWLQIANIRNGEQRNTFQAVLATNSNETYILFRYPSLEVPYGLVGYINNQCSSVSRSLNSFSAISLAKKEMRLSSTQRCNKYMLKNDKKSTFPDLVRKILTVIVPVALVGGIIRLTTFCKSYLRERRRRVAQHTAQVPGPSGINQGHARNNHVQRAQRAEANFSRIERSIIKEIEPAPPRLKSDTMSVPGSYEESETEVAVQEDPPPRRDTIVSPRNVHIHYLNSRRVEIVNEIQIHRHETDGKVFSI